MGVELTFRPVVVEYSVEERAAWSAGDRADCIDTYCAGIGGGEGTGGFGEYIVGRYWQQLGYRWIHHDFDIFGGNRDGKYPESQAILENAIGADRLKEFKALCASFRPFRSERHGAVEQPDLLIYKPDTKEVRFAECKRRDTGDKLNSRQALGLYLIASQLKLPVDLFLVAKQGTYSESVEPITLVYEEGSVRVSG